MTVVFIGGSRVVSRLNRRITERLDNIMNRQFSALIGDANGADKAVQRYFASRGYRNVTVHCMDVCRNNVGEWPISRHTAQPNARRDRHYYAIKDEVMANQATCGFMLWDGRSKGTLANVLNLLNSQKKVLLYVSPKKSFFTLTDLNDLHDTLEAVGIRDVPQFLVSLGLGGPTTPPVLRFG